jgi:hypothetical protein
MSVAKVLGTSLVIAFAATAVMAGCGRVERTPIAGHPGPSVPARPNGSGSPDDTSIPDDTFPTTDPVDPTAVPTATAPPDTVAVPCAGRPSGSQVISVVRRDRRLLPAGVTPTVVTGPLCAGDWQYTIIAVPDHDRLQVITRGGPSSLAVVVAGTYVCTPAVTGAAPTGIVSAAHCQ